MIPRSPRRGGALADNPSVGCHTPTRLPAAIRGCCKTTRAPSGRVSRTLYGCFVVITSWGLNRSVCQPVHPIRNIAAQRVVSVRIIELLDWIVRLTAVSAG